MPLPSTYIPIATNTLTTAPTEVLFSNIPQNYTDLVLVMNVKNSVGNGYATQVQYNSDTSTNYSWAGFWGYNLSTVSTTRASNVAIQKVGFSSVSSGNVWSVIFITIPNYSNSSVYKTLLARTNSIDANSYFGMGSGLWRSTAAINQIKITSESSGTFATSSTFTVYGIKAAS